MSSTSRKCSRRQALAPLSDEEKSNTWLNRCVQIHQEFLSADEVLSTDCRTNESKEMSTVVHCPEVSVDLDSQTYGWRDSITSRRLTGAGAAFYVHPAVRLRAKSNFMGIC